MYRYSAIGDKNGFWIRDWRVLERVRGGGREKDGKRGEIKEAENLGKERTKQEWVCRGTERENSRKRVFMFCVHFRRSNSSMMS